jgi:DNA-directed RNA polymerase specialized sigma24 family protein
MRSHGTAGIVSARRTDRTECYGKSTMLTPGAFEKLLDTLSEDRQQAGEMYVRLRLKTIKFLEWRGCATPDVVADETLDRVARHLAEGKPVRNLPAFVLGVAAKTLGEQRQRADHVPLDSTSDANAGADDPRQREAQREAELLDAELLERQRRCLALLPPDDRAFIIEYHQGRGRERIERRRALAGRLGMRLNAVRIRAHRIRRWLFCCMKNIGPPGRVLC